ncbi:hypothetical protein LOD99_2125 [Oopsacas minuta]|uniref:Uncharacterized protein n=1 Tax=Oopsacas minuta TaxID=111878 RepID=A0AAV7K300_9METZ|nr:hypothetical protein LOD99_2125 [Oopsacas minuta]
METLYSKEASILSTEMRDSVKDRFCVIIKEYKMIEWISTVVMKMERMIVPFNQKLGEKILNKLPHFYNEFDTKIKSKIVPVPSRNSLTERYNHHLKKITLLVINNWLPIEYKESLFYIERTLAEPSLYSLNGLIMWKVTAEKKIYKIQNQLSIELPKQIESIIVNRYESLRLRLKKEILKMRNYPIPEHWCSKVMKEGLTHVIEGEFIFYVDPEIEKDMKPIKPSKRDLLPGGITRQEYDLRLNRLKMEYAIARDELETRNADDIERKCRVIETVQERIEKDVIFTFKELSFLYRDARSLEYLVRKNEDDKELKQIYDIVLRKIRHYYTNRINIPSIVIDTDNKPMQVAPPKAERNIPVASGVDRGGVEGHQLDTPTSVIVIKENVIVGDRYGDTVSRYRAIDLAATEWYHHPHSLVTPASLANFNQFVFVCYSTSSSLSRFSFTWKDSQLISDMKLEHTFQIPQACCTTSNSKHLYVGTLKPSLIRMQLDPLGKDQEYPLKPILHTKITNRYPWLQDMKTTNDYVICLFTGSPSPLQMFSLQGKLIKSILTEDQIAGAYNFNLFQNPNTDEVRIYICDFWDNSIKVFDLDGKFIETVCETGHGLCQTFRPSCIFIEKTGIITYGDMKVDNCLQIF